MLASAPFDEEELNHVMELRKWIEPVQQIEWRVEEGYQHFQVPVQCEEAYALRLIGTFTVATGYYKYNLFLGSQPIRMLHVGKSHHNPGCTQVGPRHKHQWSDEHGDHWAHEPDDIDFSDMETAFWTFLKECAILYEGRFVRPIVQKRLF